MMKTLVSVLVALFNLHRSRWNLSLEIWA